MVKVQEKGRRLHIEVGDDESAERFVIEPVNVETGAALLAHLLGIVASDGGDSPEEVAAAAKAVGEKATEMMKLALGEGNYAKTQLLRSAEARDVAFAALFWNTEGGGIGVTNTYVENGFPKAMSAVFAAAGLLPTPLSTT